MSEVTAQECKVRYVYLEMILNKETKYDVVSGLFKGIIEKNNDTFILLHGLKNATAVLNTKFYNIMSIEVLEDEYKNMTYLTSESQDQEMAAQIVGELYDLLIGNSFGIEDDVKIIDIDKYKDVPEEYKDGKPITSTTVHSGTKTKSTGSFNSPTTRYQTPVSGSVYNKTYTKADPEPALISRSKSKRPTKSELDIMREKIEQIKAGEYVAQLPETLGGEPSPASERTLDDDEDIYNGIYGNRGFY